MKNKYLLGFMLVVMTTLWSCKKDNSLDNRDNYVATYNVTETWTENTIAQSKPVFSMTIEKSVLFDDKILINNFANYGTGFTAEATISGTSVTIPQQTLPNLKKISGSGVLADPALTFTYTETVGSTSISVTATATKR